MKNKHDSLIDLIINNPNNYNIYKRLAKEKEFPQWIFCVEENDLQELGCTKEIYSRIDASSRIKISDRRKQTQKTIIRVRTKYYMSFY